MRHFDLAGRDVLDGRRTRGVDRRARFGEPALAAAIWYYLSTLGGGEPSWAALEPS